MKRSKGRVPYDQYRAAMVDIYNQQEGHCANCKRHIAIDQLKWDNFAHLKTKNGASIEQVKKNAVLVCEELHHYQHKRSNNLSKHDCVRLYLLKYGSKFWPEVW